MIKILAGTYKNRLLQVPPEGVRPTANRVRESLFNILGDRVVGKVVLDLFSGSGALGIEALSRGAQHCIFVEKDKATLAILHKNLLQLQIPPETTTVVPFACLLFLSGQKIPKNLLRFRESLKMSVGLIFADPPYSLPWDDEIILSALEDAALCTPHCLCILEQPRQKTPPPLTGSPLWQRTDIRTFGHTELRFWQHS